jgi:hypothetical protein
MDYIYSVEEAQDKITGMLTESTGWKYLKSRKCLKKTVKDLVFEINFFGSKWNQSHQSVEMNADFRMSYKKYGTVPVNIIVASVQYLPEKDKQGDGYWFDISTEKNLLDVYEDLNDRIQATAVQLALDFESDFIGATERLLSEHFEDYNVRLDFIADILGTDAIKGKAKEIYDNLSDEYKRQVSDYKNGDRSKSWMINRSNLKYIADNDLGE